MDILAINDAIMALEDADSTVENVHELASLYIVQDKLTPVFSGESHGAESELNDIFPYYKKYVEIKTRYQKHQATEGEVIHSVKAVCRELSEFIQELYSGTDMNKERICIKEMLKQLNEKYDK